VFLSRERQLAFAVRRLPPVALQVGAEENDDDGDDDQDEQYTNAHRHVELTTANQLVNQ
jgi:hypothetical protein